MQIKTKRVLVTGGTRGIGAEVAAELASQGAHVVINGRHEDDAARSALQRIESTGGNCELLIADMGQPDQVAECVARATERLGGLDIVIHSAGGPSGGTIDEISTEQWMDSFAVHVHAAFHLCRHALPLMRKNAEGAIVLVSSAAAIRGCPGALAYGTVKGAILQFTRMLARDVADDNIRVNCVLPGIIRTRFHEKMTGQQKTHNLANRIPLHREGTVHDVAEVVILLVTNEFMTGESVVVDGGMTMQVVR